jgi:hypothetical protein
MTNPVNKKVDRERVEAMFAAAPKRSNDSIGIEFGVSRECIRGYRTTYERRLRNVESPSPFVAKVREITRKYEEQKQRRGPGSNPKARA